MAVSNPGWEKWLDRLYNLRRDKSGSHERPHKPALLLSIIDLLDRGVITRNEVPLSDELVATFKRYFAVVRKHNDQPTIQNPFFHLCGDKFWRLVPATGEREIYQEGSVCQPHDVPILVAARLLKPLGNPSPYNVKFFAASELLEQVQDRTWLAKVTNALNQHWQKRNAAKKNGLHNGSQTGHGLPDGHSSAVNS
jgi:hypothetical protein